MKKNKKFVKYVGISLFILAYAMIVINQIQGNQWSSSWIVAIIFLASIILWINVSIEWPSLVTLLLLGMLPEIGFKNLGEISFGNQTFIFLIFTFAVTHVLIQTGALGKLTQKMMNIPWVGQSASHYLISFLVLTLLLACIFSPSVLFMFLFPMYESICQQCQMTKGDRTASLYLLVFISSIALGTAMTPINHIFALTAMSLFQESSGQSISYISYMSLGIPTGLCIFIPILVYTYHNIKGLTLNKLDSVDKDNLTYTHRQKVSLILYGLMILLWLLPDILLLLFGWDIKAFVGNGSMVFPPLAICMIMLLINVENQPLGDVKEMFNHGLHWPSLLLLSSTLALGSVMANPDIGFIQSIQKIIPSTISQLSFWLVAMIFIIWAGIQTNVSSNLVTVSFVTTFLMTTMTNLPIPQIRMLAMMIGFMSSMAIMTPPAMPYVSIAIGSQWTKSQVCLKYGGAVVMLSMLSLLIVGYIGMKLGIY